MIIIYFIEYILYLLISSNIKQGDCLYSSMLLYRKTAACVSLFWSRQGNKKKEIERETMRKETDCINESGDAMKEKVHRLLLRVARAYEAVARAREV